MKLLSFWDSCNQSQQEQYQKQHHLKPAEQTTLLMHSMSPLIYFTTQYRMGTRLHVNAMLQSYFSFLSEGSLPEQSQDYLVQATDELA